MKIYEQVLAGVANIGSLVIFENYGGNVVRSGRPEGVPESNSTRISKWSFLSRICYLEPIVERDERYRRIKVINQYSVYQRIP